MKSEMHIGTWQEEDRHFMMDDNLFHTARKGTSSLLYCLYNGVKTLAFQAKPLGQPHTSKFRKKKYRDTKLEVKKWKTIESQHIVRMISNIT